MKVTELIDRDTDKICDLSVRYLKIKSWFLKQLIQEIENDSVSKFLSKLGEFDELKVRFEFHLAKPNFTNNGKRIRYTYKSVL